MTTNKKKNKKNGQARTVGLLVNETGELAPVTLNTTPEGSNLTEMYRVLGCSQVDVVRLPNNTDCWVDDEALLVANPTINRVLSVMLSLMADNTIWIAGRGLFLSMDEDGRSISLNPEQRNRVETAHRMAWQATAWGTLLVKVVN